MRIPRAAVAAGLLVVETALATLGVLVHYGFTADYGDPTGTVLGEWVSAFSTGVAGTALLVVAISALPAVLVARRGWMRRTALAVPVLMVVGTLAVTPAALQDKLGAHGIVGPGAAHSHPVR